MLTYSDGWLGFKPSNPREMAFAPGTYGKLDADGILHAYLHGYSPVPKGMALTIRKERMDVKFPLIKKFVDGGCQVICDL